MGEEVGMIYLHGCAMDDAASFVGRLREHGLFYTQVFSSGPGSFLCRFAGLFSHSPN